MKASQIKLLRTQSVLKELVSQAIANLNDELLAGLCVIDVECKRGRYDAFVYLDKASFDLKEQQYILSHLKKASHIIEQFCMETEGWFRTPKLHFRFDDSLDKQNNIDKLFKHIEEELNKKNEE